MLEKTIKKVIKRKINEWVESIEDDTVKALVKKNTIVTGGCFASLMQNEDPKDYDVYFANKETVLAVANYYVDRFNENHKDFHNKLGKKTKAYVITGDMFHVSENTCHITDPILQEALDGRTKIPCNSSSEVVTDRNYTGLSRMILNTSEDRVKIYISSDGIAGSIEGTELEDMEMGADPAEILSEADNISAESLEEKEKYKPVFLSSNAITLSGGVQLVIRFYGSPEEIHSTYDFAHTKATYSVSDDKVDVPKDVYECVMNKRLIYTGSQYPVCSVARLRKFIARGWTISAGDILVMSMQISDLDLTDIDVLEQQLVGLDSIYFMNLIASFREAKEKDNNWKPTTGYVMSIVDKVFR